MTGVSRRGSRDWARTPLPVEPVVDVLIPTVRTGGELAVTLAGLAAQDDPPFRVIVSDQVEPGRPLDAATESMIRVLAAQGRPVALESNLPRRGLAEQRQFLLDRASSPYVLYLDDDVWLEPGMLDRLHSAIRELDCGFVGAAVQGISYLDDDRPHERTAFSPWAERVEPERVRRGHPSFDRWPLHNAANLTHLTAEVDLDGREWLAYKIAWIGGCVLYHRQSLVECGGFDFWRDLPPSHSGEDVAAEWRVMERFGGAGILPSGAVHLEAPTTIPVRDVDAFDLVFAGDSAPEAPLETEVGTEKRGTPMSDSPNPIEVQKHLGGLDYPASKDDIVAKAESSGADSSVLDALRAIEDREYDGPTAVSQQISK